jgi:hypothetical protein
MNRRFDPILLPIKTSCFVFIWLAFSQPSYADNWREQCRKIVSGEYLNAYSDQRRAKDAEILALKSLRALTPKLSTFIKKLGQINEQLAKENYNPELIEKRYAARAQIKVLEEQIQDQEARVALSKSERSTAERRFKILDAPVRSIFTVEFADDPEGLPRSIFAGLNWKSPCPKFRSLCPLPENQRNDLSANLTPLLPEKESCRKYSSIR